MVKILALHGFAQNPEELSSKLAEVRRLLPDAEFVITPASVGLISYDPAELSDRRNRISGLPTRFSWNYPWEDQSTHLINLDAAAEKLLPLLRHHAEDLKAPFDGILGFSQGAACAAAIASLLEQVSGVAPSQRAIDLVAKHSDKHFVHPPFKFAVLFCGARPAAKSFDWLYKDIATPSLHMIGQRDIMVLHERSQELASSFQKAEVVVHPGNHFIPTSPLYSQTIVEFVIRRAKEGIAVTHKTLSKSGKVDTARIGTQVSCSSPHGYQSAVSVGGRVRSGLKRFSIELRDLCDQLAHAPLSPVRATTFTEVSKSSFEMPRSAPAVPERDTKKNTYKRPRFLLRRKTSFQTVRMQMAC
jgi:hypothetical protein